jgi:hypothetical protein
MRLPAFRLLFICSPGGAKRNPGAALKSAMLFPDFASLHPGYDSSDPIAMKPVTTADLSDEGRALRPGF